MVAILAERRQLRVPPVTLTLHCTLGNCPAKDGEGDVCCQSCRRCGTPCKNVDWLDCIWQIVKRAQEVA